MITITANLTDQKEENFSFLDEETSEFLALQKLTQLQNNKYQRITWTNWKELRKAIYLIDDEDESQKREIIQFVCIHTNEPMHDMITNYDSVKAICHIREKVLFLDLSMKNLVFPETCESREDKIMALQMHCVGWLQEADWLGCNCCWNK